MSRKERTYRIEGIILRRRNMGEADSIFTILSHTHGKIDAIARSIRKPRSKMRGHLETLVQSSLFIARGKSLDILTQAETIDSYQEIRTDLEKSAAALYCFELIDLFTEKEEPLPELYKALKDLLEILKLTSSSLAVRHFELHLLNLLGYQVHVSGCVVCDGRLPEQPALLVPAAGGFVCSDCRLGSGAGRIVSVPIIKLLRFASKVTLRDYIGIRVSAENLNLFSAITSELIRYHLEREPKSKYFLDNLPPAS